MATMKDQTRITRKDNKFEISTNFHGNPVSFVLGEHNKVLLSDKTPTDEGWSSYREYYWIRDGQLRLDIEDSGRDCDGLIETFAEYIWSFEQRRRVEQSYKITHHEAIEAGY